MSVKYKSRILPRGCRNERKNQNNNLSKSSHCKNKRLPHQPLALQFLQSHPENTENVFIILNLNSVDGLQKSRRKEEDN